MNSIEIPIFLLLFVVIIIFVAVIAGLILLRNAVLSRIFASPRATAGDPEAPKQKSTLQTLMAQSDTKTVEVNQPQAPVQPQQSSTATPTPAPQATPQTPPLPIPPEEAHQTQPQNEEKSTGGIPSGVKEETKTTATPI